MNSAPSNAVVERHAVPDEDRQVEAIELLLKCKAGRVERRREPREKGVQ